MSKLVVISLGQRALGTGFPSVRAQIWSSDTAKPINVTGRLPQDTPLTKIYAKWRKFYEIFYQSSGLRRGGIIEVEEEDITNFSKPEFEQICQNFPNQIDEWLKSREFQRIDQQIRAHLQPTEEIQVVIETEDILLQRIPWQHWQFFQDFRYAELALSPPEYQPTPLEKTRIPRSNIRILAVLGNSTGIDLTADRQLLENLPDNAETVFLVEPSREELDRYLWDEQGWDILFFAGHSQTDGTTGTIEINPKTRLPISDLSNALRKAIERGLHLAIFNSCDGLGIAQYLADLNIPQLIVMREPVPDKVAQEFLKHFLGVYSGGKSLYISVREAREKLQGLEDNFPCASWLPVICQNPTITPKTWQELLAEKEGQANLPTIPYQGLFAFQEEDAPLFFGRETFTEQLVEAVHDNKHVIGVIGASGSGKSSVVFAGLIPQLRAEGNWKIVSLRTGDRPFHALANALVPALEPDLGRTERILKIRQLESAFKQEQWVLRDLIEDFISQNPKISFLLVIDQFEEIYTLCADAEERQIFLDRLLETADHAFRFTVVLTLRADFLTQALASRPFADALQKGDIKLGPMTREELESAIVKPAAEFGVQFERGLTRGILDEIEHEPGSLPLLEFALTQLWEQRKDGLITHEAYNEIGGVKASLARYADEIYQQLSDEDQKRAETIFIQLVRPGEGTEDTRKVATRSDIGESHWDLVKRLADARLIVTGRVERTVQESETEPPRIEAEETVEVIHEALIREWLQLREWMGNNRDFRLWQDRLRVAREQWQASRKDEDLVLRGAALATAQDWLAKRPSELNAFDKDYIRASLQLREKEKTEKEKEQAEKLRLQREANFRLRIGLGVSVAFAVLAGLLGIVANYQNKQASKSEVKALVSSSQANFVQDKKLEALLDALRATVPLRKVSNTELQTDVMNALQQSAYTVRERQQIPTKTQLNKISYSPDGKLIAGAGNDGTVTIYNSDDGKEIKTLTGHKKAVNDITFSPDGTLLATVGKDSQVIIWDVASGEIKKQWESKTYGSKLGWRTDSIIKNYKYTMNVTEVFENSVAEKVGIKKDDLVLEINGQKTSEVWEFELDRIFYEEAANPSKKDVLLKLYREGKGEFTLSIQKEIVEGSLNSVNFSPDGKNLLTTGDFGNIRLWDLEGKEIKKLDLNLTQDSISHIGDHIVDASFSPDGKLIYAMSNTGYGIAWKADGTYYAGGQFTENNQPIVALKISPNGSTFVVAEQYNKLHLRYRSGHLITYFNHYNSLWDIAFSPDGKFIASVGNGQTLALWNNDGTLIAEYKGHNNLISGVAFSPDGKTIATASYDKTIRFWNVENYLTPNWDAHNGGAYGVSYSPDGKTIVSVGEDNQIKLWDNQGILQKSWQSEGNVTGLTYIEDGKYIVSYGISKTVKIWTTEGELIQTLKGHTDQVNKASFSPDGELIVTASNDKTARLWKRNGELIKIIEDHSQEDNGKTVSSVSFSPDGQTIATTSGDKVRLYNTQGELLKTLEGHTNDVVSVNFSPDGKLIISGSSDGTAKIWNLQGESLITLNHQGGGWVTDAIFSPDGKLIATAGGDKKIKLWTPEGKLLTTLEGHHNAVWKLSFSPDSKILVSAGQDGKLMLWDLNLDLDAVMVKACHVVESYLATNPNLSDFDKNLCQNVEPDWEAQGLELAQTGDVEGAIKLFKKAKANNPKLTFDPDKKARQIAAPALIQKGQMLVIKGQVQEAIDAYNKAQEIEPNLPISASDWNDICWLGNKHGYASLVKDNACEKAAADPLYKDSRGYARLLTGDKEGALEDFKAFVAWLNDRKNREGVTETTKQQWTRWQERRNRLIGILESGKEIDPDYELDLLWKEE